MQRKYTRRHSPNLVPVQREADRVPLAEESEHHRLPWNKYCQEWPTRQRIPTEISKPSREEFDRIKRWSAEKRMQEERRFQLVELQRISAERRAQRQLEASRRLKHNSVLEEIGATEKGGSSFSKNEQKSTIDIWISGGPQGRRPCSTRSICRILNKSIRIGSRSIIYRLVRTGEAED